MSFEPTHDVLDASPETGEYRATYDYATEPPSVAIPLAVMEVTGVGLTDLDPLYDATGVDPDALDEMFREPPRNLDRDTDVTFDYHGYEITVKHFGRIVLRPNGEE